MCGRRPCRAGSETATDGGVGCDAGSGEAQLTPGSVDLPGHPGGNGGGAPVLQSSWPAAAGAAGAGASATSAGTSPGVSTRRPSASQPAGSQPARSQPARSRPARSQPAGSQPARSQSAGSQPARSQPARSQSAGSQPARSQPAGRNQPDRSYRRHSYRRGSRRGRQGRDQRCLLLGRPRFRLHPPRPPETVRLDGPRGTYSRQVRARPGYWVRRRRPRRMGPAGCRGWWRKRRPTRRPGERRGFWCHRGVSRCRPTRSRLPRSRRSAARGREP